MKSGRKTNTQKTTSSLPPHESHQSGSPWSCWQTATGRPVVMIEKDQKQKTEPNVPTAMQWPSNIRHRQRQNLCRAFRLHTNLTQYWIGFERFFSPGSFPSGDVLRPSTWLCVIPAMGVAFSRTGVFWSLCCPSWAYAKMRPPNPIHPFESTNVTVYTMALGLGEHAIQQVTKNHGDDNPEAMCSMSERPNCKPIRKRRSSNARCINGYKPNHQQMSFSIPFPDSVGTALHPWSKALLGGGFEEAKNRVDVVDHEHLPGRPRRSRRNRKKAEPERLICPFETILG